MPVLTTPRRITLYWLLLLVPTIAIGGVAVFLLRREQAQLVERAAYADEAHRAAVSARARLVVENVELLVGEVETGLLDALAVEPTASLDAFLDRWEKNNPLVRTTFRATPQGQLLRPDPRSPTEELRGFARRFTRVVGNSPPWAAADQLKGSLEDKRERERTVEESAARQEISKNVAQVQSARRDVQELLKTQNAYASASVPSTPTAAAPTVADAAGAAPAAPQARRAERDTALTRGGARRSDDSPRVAANRIDPGKNTPLAAKDAADRRGWVPAVVDGRMHLLGWVQPTGSGEVRGVEVELVALIGKLGGTLPAEVSPGEGYALRDNQQRVLQQVGALPREGEPLLRVPLAAMLLPGWEVVAYLRPSDSLYGDSSPGLLGLGMLLVGVFLAAILAGGSLLLWQARRSEQEAVQKTSFVANVSHEFKTPLTTIRLYAELLEQGRVRDAAQGGEYLRTIGRETQRLARLVNNALDFSRLEQGRKKYAREKVDLTAELRRLLATHAPRVQEAGLILRAELPVAAVDVTTDRDALEQIMLNLIDNACKYAADGGEVTVSLASRPAGGGSTGSGRGRSTSSGRGAEIRVADRGPGVPVEHRERIFEKFHRVDDALTAEKTGAGLGLSIARQLARGLGGDLRYAPREGGGAEFVLELP